jgi:hypothetical protein
MRTALAAALASLAGSAVSCSTSGAPNPGEGSSVDAGTDVSLADAPVDAAGPIPDLVSPPEPCNGTPSLCDVAYDRLTYAATHAAMAYVTPPFLCPTQDVSPRTQLDDGIRALEVEAHMLASADAAAEAGAPLVLCPGDCSLGATPIAGTLDDVRAFLAVNPREVVTLIVEGGVDATDLAAAFTAAKLDTLAISRSSTSDPWPTLQSMIAAGSRLVVFADATGSPPAWMLPLRAYVAETGATFSSTSAMTCNVALGSASAPLYLLNEFLVASDAGPVAGSCGSSALAGVANAEPFFDNRVADCTQQHGAKPTFLLVDFFEEGDVLGAARALDPQP